MGVGEAALSPAAYSLITDLFPRHKLGTALAVYTIGVYLGSGLSILLVALVLKLISVDGLWTLPLIGNIFPWQSVFFLVGLPGLLIVILIALTIREPHRDIKGTVAIPVGDLLAYYRQNQRAILHLFFGIAFMAFSSYSVTAWVPTLLERKYDLSASQAGLLLGGIITVFSTAGVLFGGRYGDRLTKQGVQDAKMRVGFVGMSFGATLGILLLAGFLFEIVSLPVLIGLLILQCFFTAMPFGSATAAVQEMVPASMRATFSALFLFVVNIIGLTGGPSMVGVLNDQSFHDDTKVHLSLGIAIVFGTSLSALLLYRGLKPFASAVENARFVNSQIVIPEVP